MSQSHESFTSLPCALMQGGTSKGVFVLAKDLPNNTEERDQLLLRIMGSPDPYKKQIDGLGGATSSTSKVVMVAKSRESGCDLSYYFGQVGIEAAQIDYVSICGNLLSAVPYFALYSGLLTLADGQHTLTVELINVKKRVLISIVVKEGKPLQTGNYQLAGVPFTAHQIPLTFLQPGGNAQGQLFPTGHAIEPITVANKHYQITLLDGVAPLVLLRAEDLAIDVDKTADELNQDAQLLETVELIREYCVQYLDCPADTLAVPRVAILFKHQNYATSKGEIIAADKIDVVVKLSSVGKFHHAIPVSALVMLAVAAHQPNTLLHQYFNSTFNIKNGSIRIGHNAGISTAAFNQDQDKQLQVMINRSARLLMQGIAFV